MMDKMIQISCSETSTCRRGFMLTLALFCCMLILTGLLFGTADDIRSSVQIYSAMARVKQRRPVRAAMRPFAEWVPLPSTRMRLLLSCTVLHLTGTSERASNTQHPHQVKRSAVPCCSFP